MALIIPFTWTVPALLAGQKVAMRGDRVTNDMESFHSGQFVWAYDYPPPCGGNPIAVIRLVGDPKPESTSKLSEQDYVDEGYAFMERFPFLIPFDFCLLRQYFERLKSIDYSLWVLRFEVEELTTEGSRMAEELSKRINNIAGIRDY